MIMKDIPLNDYAVEILNDTLWLLEDDHYKSVHMNGQKVYNKESADYYTSNAYFEKIRNMGTTHDGYPERFAAYSFGSNGMNFHKDAGHVADEAAQRIFKFFEKIQTQLNLKKNALFSIYPPGGFISWHNNANASAYNFIFTYSETGDGYWRHYDPVKKEMVTIPDVKGWQCKAGYFGAYHDGVDKIVYHTARNTSQTGLRMTVAFVMDRSEMSSGIQDWVIEDIRAE